MASSRTETQVLWGAAAFLLLADNSLHTSDAMAINIEDWDGEIQLQCDNASAPLTGDYVDFWVVYTSGDVAGDTGNDYDTSGHAEPLWRVDTFVEDPARKTVPMRCGSSSMKIIAKGNQAVTRNVTIRVRYVTHRPQ